MLTREGWLVGAGAVVLVALGRLLGIFELFLIGGAAAGLLVVAAVIVSLVRLRLAVSRHLQPPRVHAGALSRVELRIANAGRRRTPVIRLRDAVTGTRGANLILSPMTPGSSVRAAYQLPTHRRGLISIGPLEVLVGDPFGLTVSSITALGESELLVYPHIDPIAPLPMASGHDPTSGARHANALGRSGDDFYALRRYVVGDDLRRVHWPSTARHDELMVRQDELPWQGRTTVVVDSRSYSHTEDSFELAVSATASIVNVAWKRGDQVRLITTSGSDSDFGSGREHLDAAFHHLALLNVSQDASIQATLERLARQPGGGSLVLVVASLATSELARLDALVRAYASVTIVMFSPSSWDPSARDEQPPATRAQLVQVTKDAPFPRAWDRVARPTGRWTHGPRPTAANGNGREPGDGADPDQDGAQVVGDRFDRPSVR
ncbi:MAG: DUF58 domain-containing protein [Actinomycetota bacterium]|nr:DUF58 domain-containing protein [Actinomycetota bacterium]